MHAGQFRRDERKRLGIARLFGLGLQFEQFSQPVFLGRTGLILQLLAVFLMQQTQRLHFRLRSLNTSRCGHQCHLMQIHGTIHIGADGLEGKIGTLTIDLESAKILRRLGYRLVGGNNDLFERGNGTQAGGLSKRHGASISRGPCRGGFLLGPDSISHHDIINPRLQSHPLPADRRICPGVMNPRSVLHGPIGAGVGHLGIEDDSDPPG